MGFNVTDYLFVSLCLALLQSPMKRLTSMLMIPLMHSLMKECSAVSLHHPLCKSNNEGISFGHRRGAPGNVVYVIRGGEKASTDIDHDAILDTTCSKDMIGIIDVRQDAEGDSIIFARVNSDGSVKFIDEAFISSITERNSRIEKIIDDSSSCDEIEQNQAAAAALTIGSSCSSIYLIMAYDFEDGKTVLHRTLGGIKLMNLVDGVRKRFNDSTTSKPLLTKLVVFLVSKNDKVEASVEISNSNEFFSDTSQNSQWNSDGINFLVDRLKTYFELGGEDYKGLDPFSELEIVRVRKAELANPRNLSDSSATEQSCMHTTLEFVKNNIELISKNGCETESAHAGKEHFRFTVKNRFELFGGIEPPAFLKSNAST